jgi:aminoglycoside 2'-N-acetyltransferase I
MIDHIETVDGDAGWALAEPLLDAVWSPEIVATLPWKDVVWANPARRVFIVDRAGELIGHAGLYRRDAMWNGRAVTMGGVGGVATREDSRRCGVASAAMRRAAEELEHALGVDFAVLFCEPRHAPLYRSLGWERFEGEVFVMQPAGRVRFAATDAYVLDLKLAPRTGVLDLCGLPW